MDSLPTGQACTSHLILISPLVFIHLKFQPSSCCCIQLPCNNHIEEKVEYNFYAKIRKKKVEGGIHGKACIARAWRQLRWMLSYCLLASSNGRLSSPFQSFPPLFTTWTATFPYAITPTFGLVASLFPSPLNASSYIEWATIPTVSTL